MCEDARHGVIYQVFRPVADIHQVSCLDRANNVLDNSLLHSRHLTEQAHFLGVQYPPIEVCVSGRAVQNDVETWVSRVNKSSGIIEGVMHVG